MSLLFLRTREQHLLRLVYVQVRAEHVEVKLPASSTASKLLGFNDRRHRHIEIFNFLNRF